MWLSLFNFVAFLTLIPTGTSENILFYTGCGSYSQRISVWPLVEALVEKGHHITFLSSLESKSPNPKVFDYVPKKLREVWEAEMDNDNGINMYDLRKNGQLIPFWYGITYFGVMSCEHIYADPDAIAWIKKSKFDLVIIDSFMNECAYGLAYVFKAKTIVYGTFTVGPWFIDAYGMPDETSWIPDIVHHFPPLNMNFLERTVNTLAPLIWKVIREYWYLPQLEEMTRKGLGRDDIPSFTELEKNTSLVFITSHHSQDYSRSFPQNVIPIGGLVAAGKLKPLPKEMEEFVNKGKNGFVYISFGTVSEFTQFDPAIQKAFIDGVLKFPHLQFIWKSNNDLGVKLPANFLITKWAPQQDLLAHPKIKAFVTHSGLGGVTEAIYHAVPLICIPVFAEQDFNAGVIEHKGAGIKLEITTLKSEDIENAIAEITSSDRYKQQMLKVSRLSKDRPISALQSAVYWTEYVLRHDDTEFLRPLSISQSWWVRRQLDVWLFILIVSISIFGILFYIMKFFAKMFLKILCGGDNKKSKKVKQN